MCELSFTVNGRWRCPLRRRTTHAAQAQLRSFYFLLIKRGMHRMITTQINHANCQGTTFIADDIGKTSASCTTPPTSGEQHAILRQGFQPPAMNKKRVGSLTSHIGDDGVDNDVDRWNHHSAQLSTSNLSNPWLSD
jgi:hypothetical protein